MKALIIDDEKHVRDAIRLLVPWEQFGISEIEEAADGQIAIEIMLRDRPAIVFTDIMMPRLGGVEFMEWAAREAPGSKIIVVSGHEDFEFVRQTVKSGGMDYILKPIDADQLIAAVEKAVQDWRADEEARSRDRTFSMEINRLKPVYLDQFFSSLIREPGNDLSVKQTLEREFGLKRPVRTARVAVLTLDFAPPAIRAKFAAGWDLLYFSITNICNEILDGRHAGYAFRNRKEDNEIVLLLWNELAQAEELLAEIDRAIAVSLKASFGFGLGGEAAFPAELPLAYRQARQALKRRSLRHKSGGVHVYSEKNATQGGSGIFFYSYEERIRFAVQSGSREMIRSALEPWFAMLESADPLTLEQLHVWWQEFRLAQSIWRQQAGIPSASDGMDAGLPPVLNDEGTFALQEWKDRFFLDACKTADSLAYGGQGDRSVIRSIAAYVMQNLQDELSLQDIANRFYLSREYISRKFKQEMNENLSDFIARARVDRAKELLLNPQLKIARVAEMVGFQDEKYFSKVFKKWAACSPVEFRKASQTRTPPVSSRRS